jgi:large subunit ribosomal protein L32
MVIRMRHTRAHTRNRRSHHALTAPAVSACGHCGAETRPHHMCLSCGFYKGRQVLDLSTAKARRDARIKAKAERLAVDAGVEAPAEAKEVAEVKEEKAEAAGKAKRTRAVKTGASSKKEKQETS